MTPPGAGRGRSSPWIATSAAVTGVPVQRVVPFTHFRVPAVEMLFDEPLCCPTYGALTFDGLAADNQGRFHLVVRTAAARAYLGPEVNCRPARSHLGRGSRRRWPDRR